MTFKERAHDPPPSIIFIMSDDHAYQAISADNHALGKLAPTPNIDRVAKNGAIYLDIFFNPLFYQ
nr:hypothetical protein [uncultured Allomuricauda sp.]